MQKFNMAVQQNNMLVSKKGDAFTVWTLYDLKLSQEEKDEVTQWIHEKVMEYWLHRVCVWTRRIWAKFKY